MRSICAAPECLVGSEHSLFTPVPKEVSHSKLLEVHANTLLHSPRPLVWTSVSNICIQYSNIMQSMNFSRCSWMYFNVIFSYVCTVTWEMDDLSQEITPTLQDINTHDHWICSCLRSVNCTLLSLEHNPMQSGMRLHSSQSNFNVPCRSSQLKVDLW